MISRSLRVSSAPVSTANLVGLWAEILTLGLPQLTVCGIREETRHPKCSQDHHDDQDECTSSETEQQCSATTTLSRLTGSHAYYYAKNLSRMKINRRLRDRVWKRAKSCCEYCRIPQPCSSSTLEIDHLIPEKMRGPTSFANLALTCFHCNNNKGPNIAGVDPETHERAFLFSPREVQKVDEELFRSIVPDAVVARCIPQEETAVVVCPTRLALP